MNKEEFALMKFPVFGLPPTTDLLVHFQELKSYEEFSGYKDKDRNLVFRYVFFCYDKKSPLVRTQPELKKRKEQAMELAGFERTGQGKFKAHLEAIMEMKDEAVNKIIICFLVNIQNNMEWALYVANQFTFADNMRLLMKPLEGDDDKKVLDGANARSKLREECKAVIADQESLLKALFMENTDLKEIVKTKYISPQTQ
jgi:hypothetical protein